MTLYKNILKTRKKTKCPTEKTSATKAFGATRKQYNARVRLRGIPEVSADRAMYSRTNSFLNLKVLLQLKWHELQWACKLRHTKLCGKKLTDKLQNCTNQF